MTRSEAEGSRLKWLALFVFASLAVHAIALLALSGRTLPAPFTPQRPIELVPVEVQPPPPQPTPTPLQQPKAVPHPHPIAVHRARPRRAPKAPEQPPPPPDQKPAAKPVTRIVGLTMSSTTTAGTFSAPVGNTPMGEVGEKAAAPSEVESGGGPLPADEVDKGPVPIGEVQIPYPPQARKDGVEGTVTLLIVVDASGQVTRAKVVNGPGHGLNEAALRAIRRFRFQPALREGKPVPVETRFAYTFELVDQ